ncbi:MAG: gamma-glutamyl-gamma-aminobutyrate hydrolase family protein [Pirellulales bacterium]|nr:gamma-glutamyl-gamma-aminobutyrate hydrolase family protein [Pirellulales bacterium]
MAVSILILGEFDPNFPPHLATEAAIAHSAARLGTPIEARWISTTDVDESVLRQQQGLWIAPGSPYRDMARTLAAIRFAREQGLPCLGTCGGFQHLVIEYAGNVLGIRDAAHAEYDPNASHLFVSRLACSLVGREMELRFAADSLVARSYGATRAAEQYYCNFGVRPECVALLGSKDLRIVGSDAEGDVRVVELPGHPFFVGTLYVPQLKSSPAAPHPLVTAFVQAAEAAARLKSGCG